MTEMVYGAVPLRDEDPVLPKWWRTIDRWSFFSVLMLFAIGILLGLAASVPLAEENGFAPFHYVQRQMVFGGFALMAMMVVSMMRPETVRRLAVLGFLAALAAVMLLPVFSTDFGKGAVRWYSLGIASVQPSEFLKPAFVVAAAWISRPLVSQNIRLSSPTVDVHWPASPMSKASPVGATISSTYFFAFSQSV